MTWQNKVRHLTNRMCCVSPPIHPSIHPLLLWLFVLCCLVPLFVVMLCVYVSGGSIGGDGGIGYYLITPMQLDDGNVFDINWNNDHISWLYIMIIYHDYIDIILDINNSSVYSNVMSCHVMSCDIISYTYHWNTIEIWLKYDMPIISYAYHVISTFMYMIRSSYLD